MCFFLCNIFCELQFSPDFHVLMLTPATLNKCKWLPVHALQFHHFLKSLAGLCFSSKQKVIKVTKKKKQPKNTNKAYSAR